MTTHLQPCPCCGSAAAFLEAVPEGWIITCTGETPCVASAEIRCTRGEDPRPEMAKQWNTRCPAQAEQQPVATIQMPDPCDERDGIWISQKDIAQLKALPAGTKLYAGPVLQDKQSRAASDVLAERRRQIEAEGMTTAGDDDYHAAELPRAAASYILNGANDEAPSIWPWAKSWWKPRDARANYVRAAALLLAEIERLDRNQTGSPEGLLRSAQGGAV